VILADGVEEMEAVIAIDVMRRANIEVTVANAGENNIVRCSRNVEIKVDVSLAKIWDNLFDAVVVPGGAECANFLSKSLVVREVLNSHHKVGNVVAAICAGPSVLSAHGIALGKRVTIYPALQHKVRDYCYCDKNVVRDGNVLTSKGPGTAFEFALEIVATLLDQTTADKIKRDMLL